MYVTTQVDRWLSKLPASFIKVGDTFKKYCTFE